MKGKVYAAVIVALSALMLAASFVFARFDITTLSIVLALLFVGLYCVFVVKRPFLGLLTVIFLLPFERIGGIDIGSTTVRASQLVAVVMIVSYVWKRLVSKKFGFHGNPFAIPLLAFLLSNLLSLFNALNFERGVLVWIFTFFVIVVSFVVAELVTSKVCVEKIVRVLMVSAVIVSLFGLYQFAGDLIGLPPTLTGLSVLYTKAVFGFPRIQSTALEPLYFANYLLIPLGIAISLLLAEKNRRSFMWLGIVMLLAVNFVLTLSRGGYLGLVALLFVLAIVHYKRVFSKKNLSIYAAVLVVAAVAVGSLLGLSDNAREAASTFQTQAFNFSSGASIEEREGTITEAFKAWKGHPYLGIGPGNFGPFVAEQPLKTPAKGWLIVNNETVELLAETGIIGLAIFALFVALVVIRSIKALIRVRDSFLRSVLAGVFAAFIGILIQYQTFSTLFILHIWVTFGLLVALQNLALNDQKRDEISARGMVEPK